MYDVITSKLDKCGDIFVDDIILFEIIECLARGDKNNSSSKSNNFNCTI